MQGIMFKVARAEKKLKFRWCQKSQMDENGEEWPWAYCSPTPQLTRFGRHVHVLCPVFKGANYEVSKEIQGA